MTQARARARAASRAAAKAGVELRLLTTTAHTFEEGERLGHDLLARVPEPDDETVREALAGNLCRCTGYEAILDAVRLAAERA